MSPAAPLLIRRLEELSLNAWPALATVHLDGWLLRFADGFTRRANSVNPLYPITRPLAANLAAAEALYARRGLPVVFKLTEAAEPAGLDAALAARGYAVEARTSVQVLDLRGRLPPEGARPDGLAVSDRLTPAWSEAVAALRGLSAANAATQHQMLSQLVPSAAFATLAAESQIVAAGLAVAEDGCAGFFDIVTHPDHRGRGHAQRLMAALLTWGRARGAHTAYLQVMLTNQPALRLYARLGFAQAYQYWYRVKA
ncbi:MAG: GNAT family N-acetyltransferase [Anaerolineales bacterium]|nr:GNAT family N-acetyltransferase [Anaerolineales bacterium]